MNAREIEIAKKIQELARERRFFVAIMKDPQLVFDKIAEIDRQILRVSKGDLSGYEPKEIA